MFLLNFILLRLWLCLAQEAVQQGSGVGGARGQLASTPVSRPLLRLYGASVGTHFYKIQPLKGPSPSLRFSRKRTGKRARRIKWDEAK